MMRLSVFGSLAVFLCAAAACGGKVAEEPAPRGTGAPSNPKSECSEGIVTSQELFVVDEAVIDSPPARNREDGLWSFRHLVEEMAPEKTDAGAVVTSWLAEWGNMKELNGFPLNRDGEDRPATLAARVVCPWLQRTPANGCNSDCSKCAGQKLDLSEAPFRLIAIVNRMDVGGKPWARTPAGEGHFVFALTAGAADDPGAAAQAMTVSFEYALPSTRSVGDWASLWHAVGSAGAGDVNANLATLTEAFTRRGAAPDRPNGSALAQVRTNDHVLSWIGQLREFTPDLDGHLRTAPLLNTPDASLNGSSALRDFIGANDAAVRAGEYQLPVWMEAGSAAQLQYEWWVPNADQDTLTAFARGTCNGCHTYSSPTKDTNFHVSPFRTGMERLSPFVLGEEMTRRVATTKQALCAP
jgi:hypothetical protein